MELASAVRVVLATIRRRPAQLLPFYLLTLAVPAIMQVVFFLGMAAIVAYLVGAGRIAAFERELAVVDTDMPDPERDPDEFVEWVEGLQPLIETVITPTSVILFAGTLLITLAGVLALTAAVSSGQFATCFGLLRGENGIVRGIAGFKRYWLSFIGLYLLELLLWVVVTAVLFGAVGVVALFSLTLALFLGIFAFFLWLAAVIAIRAVFVFAPVAIVVEESGVIGGLRGSTAFIRAQFANAIIYYVIAVGVILGWGGVSSTLATFGAPSVAAIGSLLLVAPSLDLLKTVLYGDHRNAISPLDPPATSVVHQVQSGIRRGVGEMLGFVRSTPGLHAASLGVILLGFATGWTLIEPFTEHLEASIRGRIAGLIPPTAALEFFGNNWRVAIAIALAGTAFAVPTITGLWFNGFVFGIYGRLEAEPLVLLAFVIPHGILEIPAIIVSGALGIYLGVAVWRAWRGRITREDFAGTLERATWILIGVGVVLALAAVIEGFISPFYFRLFL